MRWSLATIALVPRGGTAHADKDERRRVFQWAASTGFAGIEISPQWLDIARLGDNELREVRDDVAASGLAISGLNVNRVLRGDDGSRERQRLLVRAIDVAAIVGAQVVTISLSLPLGGLARPLLRGCDVSEARRSESAAFLKTTASYAAARRVGLSLELHDDGLLDTAELCLDMLQRVAAENVGVNPDLGNLVRSEPGTDWLAALELLAPHTNNWHVKNYRHSQPAPVWDGDIDYAAAFQVMLAAGYGSWVSIESYFGDVLDLQTRSLAYLTQLVATFEATHTNQGSAA